MHLYADVGRVRVLRGVDALIAITWRQPRAVEALAGAVLREDGECAGQKCSVVAAGKPPGERGVVRIRRNDAAERGNRRPIGAAMITNEPAPLDLTAEMCSGPGETFAHAHRRRYRVQEIDHHRGEEGVHLLPRVLETRGRGVGGEPIPRPLLVRLEHPRSLLTCPPAPGLR